MTNVHNLILFAGAYGFSETYSSVPVSIKKIFTRSRNELERIVALVPYVTQTEIGKTTHSLKH